MATLPDSLIENLDRSALPGNWRSARVPPELQQLGDGWAKAGRSVALRVPSAIIEQQGNYLLNPAHPAFGSVAIGFADPFAFDEPPAQAVGARLSALGCGRAPA